MRFQFRLQVPFFLYLFIAPLCWAQGGGPPLLTTDTGTPGDGRWEINVLEMTTSSQEEQLLQLPYFDINYGVGKSVQLKVESGHSILQGQAFQTKSGGGPVIAGVKGRFFDDETGLSFSMYPQVQFHSFLSSPDPMIAPRDTNLILPVQIMKKFKSFALNPELGYIKSLSGKTDQFYTGLAVSKEVRPGWELVGEYFGVTRLNSDGTQMLLNLGSRYDVNEHVTLLLSAGHSVEDYRGEASQWLTELGVQLKLWRKKATDDASTSPL